LSAAGGANGSSTGAAAGAQSTSFLSKAEAFGSGLYDGAVKPLVDTIRHPIHALEGIGHAMAHPIDTAGALAHAVKDGGAKALSGDPYAIGMALGTVGSLVVPRAGEAEAAEDAVRVGQIGKLAEASEAADVAKVAEAAKTTEIGEAARTEAIPATAIRSAEDIQNLSHLFVTNPNEAVFWSGLGRGGAETASGLAAQQGGTTLEMLLNSKNIQMPVWDASNPASVAAWQSASREFAQGASGNVRAIIGDKSRPGSIWETVELPALKANEND